MHFSLLFYRVRFTEHFTKGCKRIFPYPLFLDQKIIFGESNFIMVCSKTLSIQTWRFYHTCFLRLCNRLHHPYKQANIWQKWVQYPEYIYLSKKGQRFFCLGWPMKYYLLYNFQSDETAVTWWMQLCTSFRYSTLTN